MYTCSGRHTYRIFYTAQTCDGAIGTYPFVCVRMFNLMDRWGPRSFSCVYYRLLCKINSKFGILLSLSVPSFLGLFLPFCQSNVAVIRKHDKIITSNHIGPTYKFICVYNCLFTQSNAHTNFKVQRNMCRGGSFLFIYSCRFVNMKLYVYMYMCVSVCECL